VFKLGDFFAFWAIYFFGQFFEKITIASQIFWLLFSTYYVLILTKKTVGLHFGRIFHKLIWSPCRTYGKVASGIEVLIGLHRKVIKVVQLIIQKRI
jgi:hypothetical protein